MNRDDVVAALTGPQAKAAVAIAAGALVAMLVLAWGVATRGPLATILYAFLFLFALTLFPVAIWIVGAAVPNAVGQLHFVLGAVAFDHHYLVQREHRWEWCPGDRGRVYIDGQWHDITGGLENYSVLCWRPFGILRYKGVDTWTAERADTYAAKQREPGEKSITADGGATVERAGMKEVDRSKTVPGDQGTWLIDLKRVLSGGIKKIGDIELIETAEEVIERGQVEGTGGVTGNPAVQTFIGLLLGVVSGFAYIMLG